MFRNKQKIVLDKSNEKVIDIKGIFWFFLILSIFVFVHTYKLTEIPFGLNVDEAAVAYDGLCLAQYGGVDRFLNSFPVYFVNWGDEQNAMYTYFKNFFQAFWHIKVYHLFRHPSCINFCRILRSLVGSQNRQ